jgi:Superinfection immunity protein
MSTMSALATLVLILLVLGVYWLPSILAWSRRHPELVPIVLVNALLGWTVVGWVWAIARLVRTGAAHPHRLAPAVATAAGGDPIAWRLTDPPEADLVRGIGSAASAVPLEP